MSGAATLNEVCEFIVDCLHATAPVQEQGFPLIRTPNIGKGRLLLDGVYRVSEDTYRTWTQRATPQAGDLILAREAPAGNVAVVKDGEDVCLGQRTVHLRPDKTKVDPDYLCYLLLTPLYQGRLLAAETGATAKHVNMKDIRRLRLDALPTIEQQRYVGQVIATYDDLIENNRRRIALLEQSARLLYREWFVHLRFPGHEHVKVVDGVPEGWTRSPVSELATLAGGKQYESDKLTDAGTYPVFGGNGIQGYTHEKTHDDFVIAFGRVGAYCGSVHWSYEGAWINNNASSLVPHEYPELFLHHMLHCDFRNFRKGAAQPFIPNGVLSTICFISPSGLLAAEFCEQVRSMRLQQVILAKQNKKLAQARDLLLPRLMRGDLVV